MAYLDGKPEGDHSMAGTWETGEDVYPVDLQDPRDMAKARLPESQFPVGANPHPPYHV